MSTAEAKKRAPYIFGFLVLLQLLGISVQPRPGHDEQFLLRTVWMTLFAPVQNLTSNVSGGIGDVWYNYADLRAAREESKVLREEAERWRQAALVAEEKAAEVERLREIYELQPTLPYKFVVARVISRNTSLWLDRITINRGTLQGVQKNYPVITPAGVVGHVVAVAPNAAHVQLITDERAGVGVRLKNSRALGEIRGVNGPYPELRNISNLDNVESGEEVLTSGLDGIYPKGLLVGRVLWAQKRNDDVTQRIAINPAAHLAGLEELMILQVDPAALREQIDEEFQSQPVIKKTEPRPGRTGSNTRTEPRPAAGRPEVPASAPQPNRPAENRPQ